MVALAVSGRLTMEGLRDAARGEHRGKVRAGIVALARLLEGGERGAEYFVVSSDYPHSDGAFPEAMQKFFGLKLDAEQRRKILWDNCARLYNIATPAGSLTQLAPQVSAAE